MKSLIHLFVTLSIAIWTCTANATPLTGDATVYDLAPAGNVVSVAPITGDLDTANNTMSVDPFDFFGNPVNTTSVELLGAGVHTRIDPNGASISATVNEGQLGSYLELEWSTNNFGTFMVWDVTSSSDGGAYTTTDSDGDGVPGHALASGPFLAFSLTYDFIAGDPPPGISVSVDIAGPGGTSQECNATGGSDVTFNATVDLVGGATLGSIDWDIDDASVGSGTMISPFLTLGTHVVDVTATTTTGESGSDSVTVTVQDTTPPDLEVAFLDNSGTVITSTSAGTHVTARIAPIDICDPEPLSQGSAMPVFEISDGDSIKLQSGKVNTVELPTTAVELSGSATDASGNTTSGMSVLSITE